MRVLVTGGTGFIGTYLSRYLASNGAEVTATFRPGSPPPPTEPVAGVTLRAVDIDDPGDVASAFDTVRPEAVYHLAGKALVQRSWDDPVGTFRTNLMGTLRLLQEIRSRSPGTSFAFAGSGTEYGEADTVPTPEEAPLRPSSPYAASKAAGDLLCYQYFRSFDIPVYRYRIFGTTGPGKRADSTNEFASQVAEAERRPGPHVLRVGNLDRQRDFTDVRDSVRAMVTVVEHGEPGAAYNIGTGRPRTVRQTLDTLLGWSTVPITVETDPARLRVRDEPVHLGDVTRLLRLGWAPEIPYEQTLREILDGWRETTRAAESRGRA